MKKLVYTLLAAGVFFFDTAIVQAREKFDQTASNPGTVCSLSQGRWQKAFASLAKESGIIPCSAAASEDDSATVRLPIFTIGGMAGIFSSLNSEFNEYYGAIAVIYGGEASVRLIKTSDQFFSLYGMCRYYIFKKKGKSTLGGDFEWNQNSLHAGGKACFNLSSVVPIFPGLIRCWIGFGLSQARFNEKLADGEGSAVNGTGFFTEVGLGWRPASFIELSALALYDFNSAPFAGGRKNLNGVLVLGGIHFAM